MCFFVGYAESAVASVCPGGRLNLTCNTMSDQTSLIWNMSFPHRPGYERRFILAGGIADSASPLNVSQTMFQFLRTSVSPLISVMVIDNVDTTLNGTRVECSYGGGVMSTNIINIIGRCMLILQCRELGLHLLSQVHGQVIK